MKSALSIGALFICLFGIWIFLDGKRETPRDAGNRSDRLRTLSAAYSRFATREDFAVYAEKLRQLAILKVEPMIQIPPSPQEREKILRETEEFIHRTNPKFDLSKCRLVAVSHFQSKPGSVVMINERESNGAIGGTVAEVWFDALGELQFVNWFDTPDKRRKVE